MKKQAFVIFFGLVCLFAFVINEGICFADGLRWEGDCIIRNRDQLTDMVDYRLVTGDLVIDGNADFYVGSMTYLRNIEEIGGDFIVSQFGLPTGLEGLENLNSIGGNFTLSKVWFIRTLQGVKNLTHIGGGFKIYMCPDLFNLDGLENITTIPGDVEINGFHDFWIRPSNESIRSLNGLKNLVSVGGLFKVYDTNVFNIKFDDLVSVGGYFSINKNPDLTDISFESLEEVGGNFAITENENLPNEQAVELSERTTIGGNIYISDNLE